MNPTLATILFASFACAAGLGGVPLAGSPAALAVGSTGVADERASAQDVPVPPVPEVPAPVVPDPDVPPAGQEPVVPPAGQDPVTPPPGQGVPPPAGPVVPPPADPAVPAPAGPQVPAPAGPQVPAPAVPDPAAPPAGREAPANPPGPGTPPAAGTLEAPKAADHQAIPAGPASGVAILTRLTDPVAVLDNETQREKFLFHWEKKHELRVLDGMRQGVAGVSELFFPSDMTSLRFFGETHFFLEVSGTTEHRLNMLALRRIRVESRTTPIIFMLPGGTTITCQGTVLQLSLDERDHRYHLKNDGPGVVRTTGPVLPPGEATVPAGNELSIPIVQDPATADVEKPGVETRDMWAGHTLETEGFVRVTRRTSEIELSGTGTARVGGARLVLDGSRIRVWKP